MTRARRPRRAPGDYEVGYGKTPVASRFRKGVSGNPGGRTKGVKPFGALVNEELAAPITISENGKRRSVPKGVAAAKQLVNKAASGDHRALSLLANQSGRGTDPDGGGPGVPALGQSAEDQAVIQNLLARLRACDEEDAP